MEEVLLVFFSQLNTVGPVWGNYKDEGFMCEGALPSLFPISR